MFAAAAALPWIRKFGPWLIVGLVALGVYAAATTIVKDWKKSIHDTAFAAGEDKERSRQDAIARKIEKVLGPTLDKIDANTAAQLQKQTEKETVYVDRIRTQIKNNPQYTACRVDDSVLADRNAIRASLQAPADTTTRSDVGSQGTTTTSDN